MKNLVLAFLFVCFCVTIFAATVWEQPTKIKQNYTVDWTSCMALTDTGGMLFVWSDISNGNRDIFAQAVDSDGNHVWQQPLGVCVKPKLQEYPAVAKTTTGEFVIAWADFSNTLMGTIYVQKINLQGQLLWQTGGIPMCEYPGGAMDAQVVPDTSGGVFVLWSDNRTWSRDVYGQHLDTDGNILWAADGIPLANNPTDEPEYQAKADGHGGFILGVRQDINYYSFLRAKRFNSSGTMVWNSPVAITDSESQGSAIQMAFPNPDTIIFTWANRIDDINGTPDYDIRATGVSMTGTVLWQQIEVYSDSTATPNRAQMYPLISAGTDNNVIITWEDGENYYDLTSLYAQKLNAAGVKLWASEGITLTTNLCYRNAESLVVNGLGQSFIIWQDSRNSEASGWDIYGQKLDANGAMLWETSGRPLVIAANAQSYPAVFFADNLLYMGWQDNRLGSNGIYCNMMDAGENWLLNDIQQQFIWGSNGTYVNYAPRAFPLSNGAAIIWSDALDGWSNDKLFLQKVDSDGAMLLVPNGIRVTLTEGCNQRYYQAVVTPDDNIAVVWLESTDYVYTIRAQLFDSIGNRMWGENGIQILTANVSYDSNPGISYDAGAFYFVWSGPPAGTNQYNRIYGQKISNGVLQWGDNGILISQVPNNDDLFICSEAKAIGRYFLWKQSGRSVQHYDWTNYWVMMLSPDGTAPEGWTPGGMPLCNQWDSGTSQRNYSAVRVNDGIAACWIDYRDSVYRIFGQRVSPTGLNLWGNAGLSLTDEAIHDAQIKLDFNGTNLYLTWYEYPDDTHGYLTKAQSYNLDGIPLWNVNGNVMVESENSDHYIESCVFTNGGMIFKWSEFIDNLYYHDYYRYADPEGMPLGPEQGILNGNPLNSSNDSYIVSNGESAYVCWTEQNRHWIHHAFIDDGNNDYMGVFLQKLSNDTVPVQDDTESSAPFKLSQNYPNPFNPTTNLSFSIKAASEVELTVYNIKGEKVRTLQHGALEKGKHSIVWNGLDDSDKPVASGVYMYSLSTGKASLTRKMILLK